MYRVSYSKRWLLCTLSYIRYNSNKLNYNSNHPIFFFLQCFKTYFIGEKRSTIVMLSELELFNWTNAIIFRQFLSLYFVRLMWIVMFCWFVCVKNIQFFHVKSSSKYRNYNIGNSLILTFQLFENSRASSNRTITFKNWFIKML